MNRLRPDESDRRFIRRILYIVAIGLLLVVAYRAHNLMILAFGAMLGAIVIHAIAEAYRRFRVPERWSVPLAMLTTVAAVAFLIWLFGVQFGGQINLLVAQTPHLLDQLAAWAGRSPVGAKLVSAVQAAYSGSQAAQDVGGLAKGGAELLLNSILLLVGSLFFAVEPQRYLSGVLLLVPRSRRGAIADAAAEVGRTLKLWLRAELILMTTMGVLIGLGLWISGVPSAAALGLLAGLSEFIPYVGPTLAMLPALGLAAGVGTGPLIGSLVTYVVVRLIQTNFITPYVQNRVISIPPAVTLFAIIGIGVVFGIFGLFFSAALLVVFYTLIRTLYVREVLGEDPDGDPVEADRLADSGGLAKN